MRGNKYRAISFDSPFTKYDSRSYKALAPHKYKATSYYPIKNPCPCQIFYSFGYNDTAHFLKKDYDVTYHFKKAY